MTAGWIERDGGDLPDPIRAELELLLSELAASEGSAAPLTSAELRKETATAPRIRLWYAPGPPDASPLLLGFGLLRPDGVFRAVLREEHREMSLFLPMLRWADSEASTSGSELRVLAQDGDVCLPFLLLRLGFDAGDLETARPEAGFRLYSGGRVE